MPRMAQFILALLLGLALLAWAASGVVQTTAREWFERDVSSRAQLVLVGARQSLANAWYGDPKDLQKQLIDLARDERVMGAAACDADFSPRFSTPGFPQEFSCWAVGARVRATDPSGRNGGQLQEWSTVATLPTGRVYLSVMPITNQGQELGFAILLHDLSYIERRENKAQTFLIIAFGILAVMAFALPIFVAKWARYDWTRELRSLLRGGVQKSREFQPILSDVRELVDRRTPETNTEPASARRKDRHPGQSRAVHPPARPRWRDRGSTSRQRLGYRARAGHARLFWSMDRPRQRQRGSPNRRPQRSRSSAAGRRVVSHPPCVALRGRAAGLLLRLFERRVVAPLPRGARAAGIPLRRLAAVPRCQPEVRRRGLQ